MNINALRKTISHLKSIPSPGGKEFEFSKTIQNLLQQTNFEIIGEELCINLPEGVGKCDLWLANCKDNYLLSLELKVGDLENKRKQEHLKDQVFKYSKFMKVFYPTNRVFGFGIYKHEFGLLYTKSICVSNIKVLTDLETLKSLADLRDMIYYYHHWT